MRVDQAQTPAAASMIVDPTPRFPVGLIQSAQTGDQAAIASLLEISQPDIRRYARRSCRATDIDDAVQEALWLMSRRIGSLKKLASFSAWLFAIVTRECMRLARSSFGHADLANIENDLAFANRPDHDLRIDLAFGIQSLPEHYRPIVLMRDVEELTIDEIASSLSLSRESVKARLHRARGLLREYLLK
jgi:RNA polymerase sigma factor (sigma-70 family)